MDKAEVAAVLEEIAVPLELQGENPFRANAYAKAGRAIAQLETNIADIVEAGTLDQVPGIGETLRDKISLLVTTGKLPFYDDLKDGRVKANDLWKESHPDDDMAAAVIQAIEGHAGITECYHNEESHCVQLARCNIRTPMRNIQNSIYSLLESMSIEDMTTFGTTIQPTRAESLALHG